MTEKFSDLLNEILQSVDAGAALRENSLRRKIAAEFDAARQVKGLSFRQLAQRMNTSVSQVQRLLHHQQGGSLTLKTVCRAAQILDLKVNVQVRPAPTYATGRVCRFGTTANWHTGIQGEGTVQATASKPLRVSGSDCETAWSQASEPPGATEGM